MLQNSKTIFVRGFTSFAGKMAVIKNLIMNVYFDVYIYIFAN